jgi:hypothetical protein
MFKALVDVGTGSAIKPTLRRKIARERAKLAEKVSPPPTNAKLAERVSRCRSCDKAISAPGRRGPRPGRCRRCERADQARYHIRSAARIAHELGNDRLADALTRLAEL